MVFVVTENENYEVMHINHIASSHLERLILYFKSLNIKVYKGRASLDWDEVIEYAINEAEGTRFVVMRGSPLRSEKEWVEVPRIRRRTRKPATRRSKELNTAKLTF